MAKSKKEALEKVIQEYIEKGKPLIYPQMGEAWEKTVRGRFKDMYQGADLDEALYIMQKLDDGLPLEEVKEYMDNCDYPRDNYYGSGEFGRMVDMIVIDYSKRSPDLYEFLHPEEAKEPENAKSLAIVRERNLGFELELAAQAKSDIQTA